MRRHVYTRFDLRRYLSRIELNAPRLRDRAFALPQPKQSWVNLRTAKSSQHARVKLNSFF